MNQRIIAFVDDLFFVAKIRGAAQHANAEVEFPRTADAFFEAARVNPPVLIIFDLHARAFDPFAVAAKIKADETLRGIPLVAFYSHVQTELQRQSQRAGIDRAMPRSIFTKHLPQILEGKY